MAEIIISLTAVSSGLKSEAYTQVGGSKSELWSGIYNGAGDSSSTQIRAGWIEGESWNCTMWRSYLTFDTSVLNNATVTSAVIRLSGAQYWRNIAESSQIGSFPSTNYADLKTTTDYVELPIQGTGIGTGSQTFSNIDLTLTGAGLANINSSGITQYSFRGTGDTTNRGVTITDSYTTVVLSGASLVIQYDPIRIFNESFGIGELWGKNKEKTLDDSISIGEKVRINGILPGKSFFDGIGIGETFSAGRNVDKIVFDGIIMREEVRRHLNGVLVGKWKKVAKTITGWTEQIKTTSSWRKTPKK